MMAPNKEATTMADVNEDNYDQEAAAREYDASRGGDQDAPGPDGTPLVDKNEGDPPVAEEYADGSQPDTIDDDPEEGEQDAEYGPTDSIEHVEGEA